MSSSLFFHSSPPRAPSHFQDQALPQSLFFTPQAHRTFTGRFAADRWASSFPPSEPARPLRESWNTGNLRHWGFGMKQSAQSDAVKGAHGHGDENDMAMQEEQQSQNQYQGIHLDADAVGQVTAAQQQQAQSFIHTPFLDGTSTIDSQHGPNQQSLQTTYPRTSSSSSPSATTFVFSSPINTASTSKNPFAYQDQFKRSNPTTQLSNRITNARSSRKSDFISRLRRTRHDERDARGLDSFERGEYLRERREWEEMMQREGARWEVPEELVDMEGEEEAISPIDEEREVEVLVEEFLGRQQDQGCRAAWEERAVDRQMDPFDENDDDSGYEEAFLEMLSQERQVSQGTSDSGRIDQQGRPQSSDGGATYPEELGSYAEGVMDVS